MTDNRELPVIWLLPPEALLTSNPRIYPIPIAVSATLVCIMILSLVMMYNRKPRNLEVPLPNIELVTMHDNTHDAPSSVIAPAHQSLSTHTNDHRYSIAHAAPPKPNSATNVRSYSSPPRTPSKHGMLPTHVIYYDHMYDTTFHETYSRPSRVSLPSYYDGDHDDDVYPARSSTYSAHVSEANTEPGRVITAASSNFSISLPPTALSSRQNSICHKETGGAWMRLRLGSE